MGGKKSTFFSLDEVTGQYSSFGTENPDPPVEVFYFSFFLIV